ncbi:MAG: ISAs1 family transposase [Crocosphaera sp.]
MKLRPKITLIDHFEQLSDPRVDRTKDHKLIDIIVIALCAMICGADNFVAMETYGNSKYEWLKQFLELKNGVPSHDTFARVFARIDPNEFEKCFRDWVSSITELMPGDVVNIDGKTVKHSVNKAEGKKAIHLVNAWATEQRLVLAQQKIHERTNEITAIPHLIKVLELNGCLVTIDAMGTQTDIAQLLHSKGADYCLALKGNQRGLFQEVQKVFNNAQKTEWLGIEHSFHRTVEKGHGRIETRRYWTFSAELLSRNTDKWAGLQSIGIVESVRRIGDKTTTSTRYYLNSFASDAVKLAIAVRSHWSIENNLHWVLDVAFNEDDCPVYKDNAPENLARLRQISLNLLSQEKTAKIGVKNKRLKAAWDNKYLAKVLGI